MSRRCFIFIMLGCIYLCLPVTSVEQNECRENEVLVECPACSPADCCPLSEADNTKSPQPNPCPPPKCKCQFNFRRAKNGTCIPTRECPPFECVGPNEHYDPCPHFCPSGACSPRLITRICPKILILECNPKCTCDDGYGRLNGTCVPFEQCPNICRENEEYHPCVQKVRRPQKCHQESPNPNTYMVNNEQCERGCICKKNYYRNQDGNCVTRNECDVSLCPGPNEEWTVSRTPNCPVLDTCISIVAKIRCDKPEVGGCTCIGGYLRRNRTSPCMPSCECPQIANSPECQPKIME